MSLSSMPLDSGVDEERVNGNLDGDGGKCTWAACKLQSDRVEDKCPEGSSLSVSFLYHLQDTP